MGLVFNDEIVMRESQILEQALSTNPKTQKALQKLINQALKEIKPDVISAIRSSLGSDPRNAAAGVRRIVYRKMLGGDINIRNRKRGASTTTSYEPVRKLQPHQRGGNRVPRSRRTDEVMHYGPLDRQWILRIVNSGTTSRTAGTRNGRLHGNRGAIAPRNFFVKAGTPALQHATEILSNLIDTELEKILNKNN